MLAREIAMTPDVLGFSREAHQEPSKQDVLDRDVAHIPECDSRCSVVAIDEPY